MNTYHVEYAISFGIERFEGLWKIEFPHPLDVGVKKVAYLPMTADDERIGRVIDGIYVAQPGERMVEVLQWLYDQITKYPYYWPWEGTYVDRYGYDFEVDLGMGEDEPVERVEISLLAYEIVKKKLNIQPTPPPNPIVGDDEWVEPGGVLVKLVVTLDRPKPVSEISIAPFTKYPMEVVSISYEEDIETFHPRKEIILDNQPMVGIPVLRPESPWSTESITFKFSEILARRFTIILRQPNYVKNTYLINEDDLNKKDLWEKIAQREAEDTLGAGESLYLLEIAKRQIQLWKWRKQVESKRRNLLNKSNSVQVQSVFSDFRREFKEAVQRYLINFVESEESEDTSHKPTLSFYNKTLRSWIDWLKRQF